MFSFLPLSCPPGPCCLAGHGWSWTQSSRTEHCTVISPWSPSPCPPKHTHTQARTQTDRGRFFLIKNIWISYSGTGDIKPTHCVLSLTAWSYSPLPLNHFYFTELLVLLWLVAHKCLKSIGGTLVRAIKHLNHFMNPFFVFFFFLNENKNPADFNMPQTWMPDSHSSLGQSNNSNVPCLLGIGSVSY